MSVTASTGYQRGAELISTALEAFANGDAAIVATTAAHEPSAFTASTNAHLEKFLPHGPVIARAAWVICHGGQGITQKALAAGVPVCVVPFCRDQFDVARRVEMADAGVKLHHKRLGAKRLRAAVREAMASAPAPNAWPSASPPAAAPRRPQMRSRNCWSEPQIQRTGRRRRGPMLAGLEGDRYYHGCAI